jgi:hypothetical protein
VSIAVIGEGHHQLFVELDAQPDGRDRDAIGRRSASDSGQAWPRNDTFVGLPIADQDDPRRTRIAAFAKLSNTFFEPTGKKGATSIDNAIDGLKDSSFARVIDTCTRNQRRDIRSVCDDAELVAGAHRDDQTARGELCLL